MSGSALVTAHRRREGFLEARPLSGAGPHGEILAGFLQSEVQGDLATAWAFLDEIAAVERGGKPLPGGVGNAFSIAIDAGGATIRNAVIAGAAPEHYSLGEMRAALEMWAAAIERARAEP